LTGFTWSTDFPIHNPYQTDLATNDVFIAKLSPSGEFLIYSTYLGGNDIDRGHCIAVDASGSAYVTGDTWSTDFPIQNQYQTDQGYGDVFIAKLSSSGNSLVYSTYLGGGIGGEHGDWGFGIAVDAYGSAYVTGWTSSTDFPTLNPYQTHQGDDDAFVTKFGPGGTGIESDDFIPCLLSPSQNYPNPFNAKTTIEFSLPGASHVKIEAFDVAGRIVDVIADGEYQAGKSIVIWNAGDLPSGIYYYRIKAGDDKTINKMILLK
jgi:hypothetical protein